MKVGVLFTAYKSQGGVYQYYVEILHALSKIKSHDFVIFSVSKDFPLEFKRVKNFKVINLYSRSANFVVMVRGVISYFLYYSRINVMRFFYELHLFGLVALLYKFTQKNLIRRLKNENLDIMIYPTPVYLSFLAKIPFMVTVHDLEHRNRRKFKEASGGGRWEYREYCLHNVSKKAFRIFVDSNINRKIMINYYHASANRVTPLPYIPPSSLAMKLSKAGAGRISKKLKLFDKYIFYPAKFWPHKNHLNLIKALILLKKKGIKVNLILTGSPTADFSTLPQILNLIKQNKMQEQVRYLGYINDEELSLIYKGASAMVMPTYFGPTNIPVYEAWKMGTPVLYSDIRGCREFLGEAGLLVNPDKPGDIADKISKIYTNATLRRKLAGKGKKKLREWGRSDFAKTIKETLRDFEEKEYVN